jgi:hypothetical protein
MPILIEKSLVSLSLIQTLVTTLLYISLMRIMYFVETLRFCKAHHMTFLGTLSYAFSRSIKTICRSFFYSLHLFISCLIKKIASIVNLSGIKLNWFSVTLVTPLKRCSMIISHSFIVWLISLIPLIISTTLHIPLFLKIGTKILCSTHRASCSIGR